MAVVSLGTENTTTAVSLQSKKQSLVLLSLAITLRHETESTVSVLESSFASGYLQKSLLYSIFLTMSQKFLASLQ